MLETFRSYYGISETDSAQAAREKIAGRLLLTDQSLHELLPVVFEFFGVTDPEHPAPRMDPETKLQQLFAVLRKEVREGKAANRLGAPDRGLALDGCGQRSVARTISRRDRG
jgi:hypothetical protein